MGSGGACATAGWASSAETRLGKPTVAPGSRRPTEPYSREADMKTWQIALLGLASLAVAGCQTDPNNALLERELFQ